MDKIVEGDVLRIIESEHFKYGSLVKVIRDDGDRIPLCKLMEGEMSLGYEHDDKWYVSYDEQEVVYKPLGKYSPFTIALNTLEEFETMKAIMHLHNKVSGSSFFDLDFTPNSEDVKEFMKETSKNLEAHHKGWSKYNKEE